MPNQQNLIPVTALSPEKAKEMSRKGGIARGKQRKERKSLKEKLIVALEILKNQYNKNKDIPSDFKVLLDESDILIVRLLQILTNDIEKSEHVLKAIDMIWDRLHGKPKQSTDITSNGEAIIPKIILGE